MISISRDSSMFIFRTVLTTNKRQRTQGGQFDEEVRKTITAAKKLQGRRGCTSSKQNLTKLKINNRKKHPKHKTIEQKSLELFTPSKQSKARLIPVFFIMTLLR